MKLHYFAETDSLYIELSDKASTQTDEISDSIRIDRDADGKVVGFDIDHASAQFDLSRVEADGLPHARFIVAASPPQ